MKIKEIQEYIPQVEQYYFEVEEFYKSMSFEDAVRNAAQAILPSGIKSCSSGKTTFANHQRRVGKKACKMASENLLVHPYWLELEKAKSFEDIFSVTEKIKGNTRRLGDLWSYDTAQRIALNKGWYPTEVYLQSGSKEGAIELVKAGVIDNYKIRGFRAVKREVFPEFLMKLKPYIIENILCVGKRKDWFTK